MTSADSFIFEEFSQGWFEQWLQWNVSSHDSFDKKYISNPFLAYMLETCNRGVKSPFLCFLWRALYISQSDESSSYFHLLLPHVTCKRSWLSPCQALYMRNISPAALQPINQALQQPWNEPYAAWAEHRQKTMCFIFSRAPVFLSWHSDCLNLDSNSVKNTIVNHKIKCWLGKMTNADYLGDGNA